MSIMHETSIYAVYIFHFKDLILSGNIYSTHLFKTYLILSIRWEFTIKHLNSKGNDIYVMFAWEMWLHVNLMQILDVSKLRESEMRTLTM